MLDWLFAPPSERRLLSGERRIGPTTYLIAIMTFVMLLVAAAGLALSNTAAVVARGIETRYAVQLPDSSAAPRLLNELRAVPGVTRAEAVPESEIRDTLERWLGPAGLGDELPMPALLTLELAQGADRAAIARRVERAVRGARFVAHEETLRPLLQSLAALQWLTAGLVALMAIATAAAVVLAARGALDTHRFTIEVMHGIGATDRQVARLFQRRIALDALTGAFAGAIIAAVVLALLVGGGSTAAADLTGGPLFAGRDLAILALLPVAAVLLATGVARAAVLATLRRAL